MGDVMTYLFAADPGAPVSNLKLGIALGLTALLFAMFFLIPLIRRKTEDKALKKTLARSRGGLLFFAIIFLLLIWFRAESVHVLSMRFFLLVAVAFFVAWSGLKAYQYRSIKTRIERADQRRMRK
jgi:hypothetical protein